MTIKKIEKSPVPNDVDINYKQKIKFVLQTLEVDEEDTPTADSIKELWEKIRLNYFDNKQLRSILMKLKYGVESIASTDNYVDSIIEENKMLNA